MQDEKARIRELLQKKLQFAGEAGDEEIARLVDEVVLTWSERTYVKMADKQRLSRELFNELRRFDVLQEFLDDPEITEIMINGYKNIFIEKDGTIRRAEKEFSSREKLEDIIQQMVSKSNRMVNEANPIVDARLSDGSRIHVVLHPVSLDGSCVTIRKFPIESITMEQLIAWEAITAEAADFLRKLVISQYNIFVSGGTGSGKTTLLNVLSNFIPAEERVITIEDSAELQIKKIPNLVRLETRESILEGTRRISMEHLIKASLRMRPDFLIIGEVRDAEAVINMLQAMNTGAAAMSTGHANGPEDMLNRLETLVLIGMDMPLIAARKQIASAIDIIIHLGRLRDKTRRVLEIAEVLSCKDSEIKLNPLFTFSEEGIRSDGKINGRLTACGEGLKNMDKLKKAGITL